MEIRVTRSRKIFGDGKHNAFTGIAALGEKTFVTFRSAATHASFDGTIKVIASDDREGWETVTESVEPGRDLRDPKLVTFKDRLLVYCGSRDEKTPGRISEVIASSDGVTFEERRPVAGIPDGHWLWWATPCGDVLYASAYDGAIRPRTVALFKSGDGVDWEKAADFPVSGNETAFDFDANGRLWALVRDDSYGSVPTLCMAEPPYSSFKIRTRLPIRLQGPMLKRLEGGCVIVGRRWDLPGRRNLRTELFWLADERDIQPICWLPSGGDTSYAGWLDLAPGAAVMSYYSSHEHNMGTRTIPSSQKTLRTRSTRRRRIFSSRTYRTLRAGNSQQGSVALFVRFPPRYGL
ncbi:MAG: hypothetical protein GXP25_19695 [Planctomycetes bacterium]|nr:hypothetical protein [Planctomycetota bacterium]